jgi:TolB protein
MAALLGAGLMVSLGASAGVAGYPGSNGKIAFSSDRGGGDSEIWTMSATGDNPTQLTTNSVKDYSPSYGPNGQRIAFVRETATTSGDIWIMTGTGGSPDRLTSNSAHDDTPAIGPSGARIAFTRYTSNHGDLWSMNIDGSNLTQLTETNSHESDPVYSPDGSKIAFTCGVDGVMQLCSMNVDGSGRVQLTDCQDRHCVAPDYSPSGNKIVYAGYCLEGTGCEGSAEIWTISANGGNKTRLTPVGGWAEYPHYSPDASKIGFSSGSRPQEISVLKVSDGSITNLTWYANADDWGSDRQAT